MLTVNSAVVSPIRDGYENNNNNNNNNITNRNKQVNFSKFNSDTEPVRKDMETSYGLGWRLRAND